jgi:outer membrane protein OmpA-like peptidoglycan-associated protein
LTRARDLVTEAEKELNENRYDTDKARILARQAKREARHALYLGSTIKEMRARKQTWEDLFLGAEQPITDIAATMNVIPSFDAGFRPPTDAIVKSITEYQKSIATLTTDYFDAMEMNTLLIQRNAELQEKMGDIETTKSILARRLEDQAKIEAQYDEVEKLFTGEVAVFVRQGRDIIIRTVGLTFPVGKATIDPKYYEFLARVGKAIGMFAKSTITVEGHTDSYGSDETNLRLSVERAEAVKAYLSSNVNIAADRIQSMGYGESRPIASNETDQGRSKNRRIEVVIHPNIAE